jgi:hypothetical protein
MVVDRERDRLDTGTIVHIGEDGVLPFAEQVGPEGKDR